MSYTLITRKGRIMQFYIAATAELYQTLYGGVILTPQILTENVTNQELSV